jgi:hypothetical protein
MDDRKFPRALPTMVLTFQVKAPVALSNHRINVTEFIRVTNYSQTETRLHLHIRPVSDSSIHGKEYIATLMEV